VKKRVYSRALVSGRHRTGITEISNGGCKLLRAVVLSASLALAHAQPHDEPKTTRVQVYKAAPAAPADASTIARFETFYAEFSKLLAAQSDDGGTSPWVFRVDLQGDGSAGRARILVSAEAGNLTVRVGSVRARDAWKRLPSLVRRSVAISRDPSLRSFAMEDAGAMQTVRSGHTRR